MYNTLRVPETGHSRIYVRNYHFAQTFIFGLVGDIFPVVFRKQLVFVVQMSSRYFVNMNHYLQSLDMVVFQ